MYQQEADAPAADRIDLGPDSLLWRYAGDTRIAFMGGTIGLLQLMHPAIGAGVLDHSNFFEDPSDRVFRSLPRILGAVYDGPAAAGTGLEVRAFHRTIRGTDASGRAYHALDPATFWWAHATFQFMAEQVADRWDRHRLTDGERDQLYREGLEWYRRYAVSDRVVPPDRTAFQREWDRVCAEDLEVNEAVRFVLDLLDAPLPRFNERAALPPWLRPIANTRAARAIGGRGSRVVAIGGLPRVVRERFDIPWSRRDQAELDVLEAGVARTWRLLPASARWQPRALDGWRRATGSAP